MKHSGIDLGGAEDGLLGQSTTAFSTITQWFQLEITLVMLLRTISFFPNFCPLPCSLSASKIIEKCILAKGTISFHGFRSPSELKLTSIRVPERLPSEINFSVSDVIISLVSVLVYCYDG